MLCLLTTTIRDSLTKCSIMQKKPSNSKQNYGNGCK